MLAAALLLAATAQPPARDTPAAPAGSTTVRGRVLADGEPPRPLSRVEVHAVCAPLHVDQATLTDASGRYEIAGLPPGRYTIAFTRTRYVRASYGQRRPLGSGTLLDLAAGGSAALDDVVLQRSGAITGRIVDEFGDPATGAIVSSMRWAFVGGERRLQPTGAASGVDDRGEYRLYGLPPGRYILNATLRRAGGFGDYSATAQSSYVPTFYPGTGRASDAQRLTVAPGQTLTAINLTLQPVAASRISGTALDAQGRPLAGASVSLSERGIGFANTVTVRPDGSFVVGGVAPGDYTLQVNAPGAPDETAVLEVTVAGTDVTDLQLVARKPSLIRGRVVFESGGAMPPSASAVTVAVSSGFNLRSAPVRGDGTFEIEAIAGHATIAASMREPGAWSVMRIVVADGSDIADTGIDIPANGSIEGVIVELTSRRGEISATVTDNGGAVVRDAVVVVFAQDPLRWKAPSRWVRIGSLDAENLFRVHLPPGDYLAASYDPLDASIPPTDPDVLQQLRNHAVKISVGAGETRTITVPLGPLPIY
jgi:hypothetical protein